MMSKWTGPAKNKAPKAPSDKIALVVEDTPANRDFFERLLAQAKYTACGASTGKEALEKASEKDHLDLAVIDMQLPDMSGLQLTSELRKRFPQCYIVVATMHDERSLMNRVFEKGGNCYLVKPHGFMELFKRLTTSSTDDLCKQGCIVIDQYGPRGFTVASSK